MTSPISTSSQVMLYGPQDFPPFEKISESINAIIENFFGKGQHARVFSAGGEMGGQHYTIEVAFDADSIGVEHYLHDIVKTPELKKLIVKATFISRDALDRLTWRQQSQIGRFHVRVNEAYEREKAEQLYRIESARRDKETRELMESVRQSIESATNSAESCNQARKELDESLKECTKFLEELKEKKSESQPGALTNITYRLLNYFPNTHNIRIAAMSVFTGYFKRDGVLEQCVLHRPEQHLEFISEKKLPNYFLTHHPCSSPKVNRFISGICLKQDKLMSSKISNFFHPFSDARAFRPIEYESEAIGIYSKFEVRIIKKGSEKSLSDDLKRLVLKGNAEGRCIFNRQGPFKGEWFGFADRELKIFHIISIKYSKELGVEDELHNLVMESRKLYRDMIDGEERCAEDDQVASPEEVPESKKTEPQPNTTPNITSRFWSVIPYPQGVLNKFNNTLSICRKKIEEEYEKRTKIKPTAEHLNKKIVALPTNRPRSIPITTDEHGFFLQQREFSFT